jgi:hypothetical protein
MNKKLIIGAVVVAAVGAALLLKKKPESQNSPNGGSGNTSSNGASVASNLNYTSLANQLFEAFDGYGTDNSVVMGVFAKLTSDADFAALRAAYGVREISSGKFNIFNSNFDGDLQATIVNEMSASEIVKLNQILKSKGITTQI